MVREVEGEPNSPFRGPRVIVRLNGMVCHDLKTSVEGICEELNLSHDLNTFLGDGAQFEGEIFELGWRWRCLRG